MRDLPNEEGRDVSAAADQTLDNFTEDQIAPADVRAEPLFDLAAAGYDLIPLRAPGDLDRHGRKIGKAPLRAGWRQLPAMDAGEAADHLRGGFNVGVRLSPLDLVVDYDPRHDPEKGALDRLVADFRLATRPRVLTGGGGTHLYLTVPAGDYVESLEGYPGVEFKGFGRQVVAPGSVHPDTGRAYRLDLDPLDDALAQEAPAALVSALVRPPVAEAAGSGTHTPDELERMLSGLDATEFRDQEAWLQVMMASHYATAGTGREEFIAWSTSDPDYADHAWTVGRRWDSLHADRSGRTISEKTLYKALHDRNRGDLIPRATAAEDFADEVEPVEGGLDEPPAKAPPLPSAAPMAVARAMLEGRAVVWSNGDWLRYDRALNAYVEEDAEAFAARVWNWTDGRRVQTKGEEERSLVATATLVKNVSAAAAAQRQGPRDLPAWHPRRPGDPVPSSVLIAGGGPVVSGGGFWSWTAEVGVWEDLAAEGQARFRCNVGE